ncbi:MAG: GTPase HflX, partial [Bacteroidales bacterium]|nr:GTPase HflX [Bacteroidales bacterium]
METAVAATIIRDKDQIRQSEEYLDELVFLAETADIQVVKRFTQRLDHPFSGTYFGSGKLDEIKNFVEENNIDYVIFDDELSPTQMRNIEKEAHCSVIDR